MWSTRPLERRQCPAKVNVVDWKETEEQETEELHPFPVTTFLSHGREQCATTSGVIDTCARTLAGTRWFEKFEVELKKHAWAWGSQDELSSRHLPGGCGTNSVPIESKPSGRRGSLADQYGSVKTIGSVIDVVEKTIEFQAFPNAKVPLEVVVFFKPQVCHTS